MESIKASERNSNITTMLYLQQFHQNRQNNLRQYQRLRSTADQNFLICSDQHTEKLTESSQPTTHNTSTANLANESTRALLILTRMPSLLSLNNNNNNDLSNLNVVSKNFVVWQTVTIIVILSLLYFLCLHACKRCKCYFINTFLLMRTARSNVPFNKKA